MARLSFAIALNLLTQNFKRGVNEVKSSFASLKSQVLTFAAALGAIDLGFNGIVSRMIETSRETNRVTTALKNVSGSSAQYASNQNYLLGLAKKYGVEINNLTASYSQFTASAQISGMSMENQRKIFEAVSRATVAFGMSADDSKGVFLALSQMMSKGKISAEELRQQMGKRLPVALQAMARAAGISVAGLDKLLQEGKLMSADVLPKFADALNEMIPKVDTNNLETSLNTLKNTFTQMTASLDVQGKYKSVIDGLNSLLQAGMEHLRTIVFGVLGLILARTITAAQNVYKAWGKSYDQQIAAAQRANAAVTTAATQRQLAESMLQAKQRAEAAATARYQAMQANGTAMQQAKAQTQMLRATQQRIAAERALERAKAAEVNALNTQQAMNAAQTATMATSGWGRAWGVVLAGLGKIGTAIKGIFSATWMTALLTAVGAFIGRLYEGITLSGNLAKKLQDAKNQMSAAGHDDSTIINLKAQYSVAKDIHENINKRKAALQNINKQLGTNFSIDQSTLRINGDINTAINRRITLLKRAAMAQMAAQGIAQAQMDEDTAAGKIRAINNRQKNPKGLWDRAVNGFNSVLGGIDTVFGTKSSDISRANEEWRNAHQRKNYYNNILRQNVDAQTAVEQYNSGGSTSSSNGVRVGESGGAASHEQTPLEQARESYYKSLNQLNAKYQVEGMTHDEYKKELTDLQKNTLQEILASKDKAVITSAFANNLKKDIEAADPHAKDLANAQDEYAKSITNLAHDRSSGRIDEKTYNEGLQKASSALNDKVIAIQNSIEQEKVEKDYAAKIESLNRQFSAGLISQQDYNEEIANAALAAAGTVSGFKNLNAANENFIKQMKDVAQANALAGFRSQLRDFDAKQKPRDTTFDYKKTDAEKLREELDKNQDYIDRFNTLLEQAKLKVSDLSQDLQDKLNNAMNNVTSLDKALKIAEVKADIKDLQNQLTEKSWSGIKDTMSGIDQTQSAIKNVVDTLNSADASGWEKIMSIWNAFTTTVDTISSIVKFISQMTTLTTSLAAAKSTEAAIDTAATATKITNLGALTAAQIAATTAQTTTAVTTSAAKQTSYIGEMAAASTAAYAAIPFVGAGLAAGQISAMMGLIAGAKAAAAGLAAVPAFANGGIVSGGPSSGDKIIARVNAGEMILNPLQQSKLFGMINNGQRPGAGAVMSIGLGGGKVKGSDLYLSLKNYMKSTGKTF